jgi:hypothetical protein
MRLLSFSTILFICAIFVDNLTFAQRKLTFNQKMKVRRELKKMLKSDQQYRKLLISHPSNEKELWRKQSFNDSLNKIQFVNLIHRFGFPSLERVGSEYSVVLTLHFTNEQDFDDLKELFQQELFNKNLSPLEYARWFDRCQINMKKSNLYGVYGKKDFCGDELKQMNKNRNSIGLENLQEVCE